ncbi:hypothetical protein QFC96_06575 [Latilactobacillus curvatus]|uniref:hypothetical protein n=1 Tax=Latilactobacillus curvatus TaxID=28038 RepID=UPI0020C7E64F|nr:hypothetical protein [Latilactobacillus curvatus]MCP8858768.1 hypothetical protein [Latilactobacillus curvatus]WHQ77557.1 hypothetical protein QFC96_06575 [Latilactobacillus curvatus]
MMVSHNPKIQIQDMSKQSVNQYRSQGKHLNQADIALIKKNGEKLLLVIQKF